jgi:hypothetical protein
LSTEKKVLNAEFAENCAEDAEKGFALQRALVKGVGERNKRVKTTLGLAAG